MSPIASYSPIRHVGAVVRPVAAALVLSLAVGGAVTLPPYAASAQTAATGQRDFDRGYADLVAKVLPAVVNVSVEKTSTAAGETAATPFDSPEAQRFFERFFGQPAPQQQQPQREQRERGEGSGFAIDRSGHIVTNAHVVGGATKITVLLQNGDALPAKLVGIDEKTDLAVIKVDAPAQLGSVSWGNSEAVRVGDKVLAVGNPFGLGGTVTAGIVSATGRELGSGPYDDFLQVDAPINRGNSGGPTFNLDGEVIGINSVIFSPSGGSVGIGFAISSNLAREITGDLIKEGSVTRGWLGVGIQQVSADIAQSLGLAQPKGAIVTSVDPAGPAAKAGLQTGDVITRFGNMEIGRTRDLTRAVAEVAPGRSTALTIRRAGSEKRFDVEIGRLPQSQTAAAQASPADDQPRLGLALADLTPDLRRQLNLTADVRGVVVRGVQPGSPAEDKGLRAGDVIVKVGDREVTSSEQVTRRVQELQKAGERSVLVLFQREGGQLFAAIPFGVS